MARYVVIGFERYEQSFAISEEEYEKLKEMDINSITKIKTEYGVLQVKPEKILYIHVH